MWHAVSSHTDPASVSCSSCAVASEQSAVAAVATVIASVAIITVIIDNVAFRSNPYILWTVQLWFRFTRFHFRIYFRFFWFIKFLNWLYCIYVFNFRQFLFVRLVQTVYNSRYDKPCYCLDKLRVISLLLYCRVYWIGRAEQNGRTLLIGCIILLNSTQQRTTDAGVWHL